MITLRVFDARFTNGNCLRLPLILCNGLNELLFEDEISFCPENHLLLTIKGQENDLVNLESRAFDPSLLSTNPKLTLSLYRVPDFCQVAAKIQIGLIAFQAGPSKVPDLSDLQSFSSVSKASTLSSDDFHAPKIPIQSLIDSINEELRISVTQHQKIHEIDVSAKESLKKELKNLKTTQDLEKDMWNKREKSLMTEIDQLESTLSSLKFELLKIKTENRALISENTRLNTLTLIKESFSNSDDLKTNPNNLSFSLNELDTLRKNSSGSTNDSSEILKQKDQVIRNLTSELNEAKVLNKSILLSRQMMKGNEVDDILMQKLRIFNVPGTFVRDPEQSYLFNGKKITVMARAGQLMCRIGTAFRPFDEFIKGFGAVAKSVSHKRMKSMGSISDSKPHSPRGSISRSKLKV